MLAALPRPLADATALECRLAGEVANRLRDLMAECGEQADREQRRERWRDRDRDPDEEQLDRRDGNHARDEGDGNRAAVNAELSEQVLRQASLSPATAERNLGLVLL